MRPPDGDRAPFGRQLALPFRHRPHYRRADFLAAPSNEQARLWLDHVRTWPGGRLALWGGGGCGKTHLAQLWAHGGGALLDGSDLPRALPAEASHYAIDDADACADERALLHLLNICAERNRPVLLTGRTAPARWPIRLADLASRLRAINSVEIGPPDDYLLQALLARLLAERQLAVPMPVQEFLLRRLPRTASGIHSAVARLDRLSLVQHQPITRAFGLAVLADMLEAEPVENEVLGSALAASPSAARLL